MPDDTPKSASNHPAVRNYTLVSLLALLVMGMALMQYGEEWGCLVLVLLGTGLLLSRWSLGPPVLILGMACLVVFQMRGKRYGYTDNDAAPMIDLILALATLVHVAGYYRLLSLTSQVFPGDARKSRGKPPEGGVRAMLRLHRSPDAVGADELPLLLIAGCLWAVVALLVWLLLPDDTATPLRIPLVLWRILVLLFLAAPVLAVGAAVSRYLAQARASPEENLLYLQDQVWRDTRREQSRLNRWLVWARRRAEKRKERA